MIVQYRTALDRTVTADAVDRLVSRDAQVQSRQWKLSWWRRHVHGILEPLPITANGLMKLVII
jgi:hypothetical protein